MYSRSGKVLVVLATIASTTAAPPCSLDGKCVDSTGHKWDLSPIGGEFSAQPATPDATWNTYAIQLYKNLDPVPAACQNAGRLGTNAAVYDNTDPSSSDCSQIGPDMNSPQVDPTLVANSLGLVFTYQYTDDATGDNQFQVTLTCGSGAGSPTPVQATQVDGGWHYDTSWASQHACRDGQKPGEGFIGDVEGVGTFGVIVLVLFFVGGGFYAGGGWFYNHRTKGYSGKEALPHIEFWRTIPGLVMDGVAFSKAAAQAKMKGEPMPERVAIVGKTGQASEDPDVEAPSTPSKKKKKGGKKSKKAYTKVPDETEEEAKE